MKKTVIRFARLPENRVEIIDFDNIAYVQDLPVIYEHGKPNYYLYGDIVYYTKENGDWGMFSKGTVFTQKEFEQLIYTMKKAGERLSRILKSEKIIEEIYI